MFSQTRILQEGFLQVIRHHMQWLLSCLRILRFWGTSTLGQSSAGVHLSYSWFQDLPQLALLSFLPHPNEPVSGSSLPFCLEFTVSYLISYLLRWPYPTMWKTNICGCLIPDIHSSLFTHPTNKYLWRIHLINSKMLVFIVFLILISLKSVGISQPLKW